MVEREVVLFLPQAYAGYSGSTLPPELPTTDPIPDTPPNGITYNVDILNGYKFYYNRKPTIGEYDGWATSGLYGQDLMRYILKACLPSGVDYTTAVSRGWVPEDWAYGNYYPSELHPPNADDWTGGGGA